MRSCRLGAKSSGSGQECPGRALLLNPCHPERSSAIRLANRAAESKDPIQSFTAHCIFASNTEQPRVFITDTVQVHRSFDCVDRSRCERSTSLRMIGLL